MDNGGHASARPQRPPEAIDFGALLEQGRPAGELVGGQSPRGAGRWAAAEGFRTARSATRHPLTDRALADTQRRGHVARRPALLCEVPSVSASGVFPSVG
jgi:hypothetical protein